MCFHTSISVIIYTSSNTDLLQILWRTKASAKGILSFYPKRIIDKKGLHELFTKTTKKLNSWLPRQVQARRRCHRLLWKTGCDTQYKLPEVQKSAKCSQAASLNEHGSGTDADADLPGEANPAPPEPKQDKVKKKCSRKRQRTSE